MPWREFGFREIQDRVVLPIQNAFQTPQGGRFACTGVSNHKSKKLAAGCVEKAVVDLLGVLVHVEVVHWDTSGKRGLFHFKKFFVHAAHPFLISEV